MRCGTPQGVEQRPGRREAFGSGSNWCSDVAWLSTVRVARNTARIGSPNGTIERMRVGYARVIETQQHVAEEKEALLTLGVEAGNIYFDYARAGKDADRPGLRAAFEAASCRGDELVVTKLFRLSRSVQDLHEISTELATRGVTLSVGTSSYDPEDSAGKIMFDVLAIVAEFDSEIIRMRTREGMALAKAKGKLRGKQPKLSKDRERRLVEMWRAGQSTSTELAAEFGVARSTVYRAIQRAGGSS